MISYNTVYFSFSETTVLFNSLSQQKLDQNDQLDTIKNAFQLK